MYPEFVLAQYPGIPPGEPPVFLGNHGGFSGARLCRVAGGSFCLKAWPVGGMTAERLAFIHRLMRHARDAGLDFVPDVQTTRDQRTWVEHAGRLWDVTTWMPGAAVERMQGEQLEAACTALARLHTVWSRVAPAAGPCPAVRRRLQAVQEWKELLARGWKPAFGEGAVDPVRPPAERAWDVVRRDIDQVPARLAPFAETNLPLHPCLCDVWHEHVLFLGDRVNGVVDYGSMKTDHAAVDLARLFGGMFGPNDHKDWEYVGSCYSQARPLSDWEERLMKELAWTGNVVALANWLKWLYFENRRYENRQVVAERLKRLVG
jgi:Ser/Thr protein kinase RdoA (MazF antagonist)